VLALAVVPTKVADSETMRAKTERRFIMGSFRHGAGDSRPLIERWGCIGAKSTKNSASIFVYLVAFQLI
jgi:hypothetical protein